VSTSIRTPSVLLAARRRRDLGGVRRAVDAEQHVGGAGG
jgi:hypothetical protein